MFITTSNYTLGLDLEFLQKNNNKNKLIIYCLNLFFSIIYIFYSLYGLKLNEIIMKMNRQK